MGFLLQVIETEYFIHSELKILAKIELSVICAHIGSCRPSHICYIDERLVTVVSHSVVKLFLLLLYVMKIN